MLKVHCLFPMDPFFRVMTLVHVIKEINMLTQKIGGKDKTALCLKTLIQADTENFSLSNIG